jgi:hypothetical protein
MFFVSVYVRILSLSNICGNIQNAYVHYAECHGAPEFALKTY